MKLITKDTDYAIRALCFIAKQKDKVVSVKELVRCLKMPRPFLRKILQILNRKGILKSYKGKGGGFLLTCDLGDISLAKLIEIFQGPMKFSNHTFKKKICPEAKNCPLKSKLDNIERYVNLKLSSITIESLLKDGRWRYGKEKYHKNQ